MLDSPLSLRSTKGQSTTSFISYKNTGNVPWYDAVSAPGSGNLPVRLATDLALNRQSVFGGNWTLGSTRAAHTFASVYEANGTTLAANQHVAQPGQIVRFEFPLSVPLTQSSGF